VSSVQPRGPLRQGALAILTTHTILVTLLTAYHVLLYDEALKKNASQLIERQWVSCTHPSYVGVRAQVCLTIELLTRAEAERRPAGKAREAPNENPHLDEPLRPSILDALGINLNFFNPFLMFKKYFVRLFLCLILLGGAALVVLLVT
jgi:hypothetical protein